MIGTECDSSRLNDKHKKTHKNRQNSFAKKNNSSQISPNDVKSIDIEILTDKDISEYCSHIYEIYHSLGGTGKTAKGSQIIETLMKEFHSKSITPCH